MILTILLMLQIILLLFITLHDWVHLPPLTDIRVLEKHSSKKGRLMNSAIFFVLAAVPLCLTVGYQPDLPRWAILTMAMIYGILTLGTIFAWWIPYFFGCSEEHKAGFIEYKDTHHFLPPRGDNIVPNTLHVILHLQIWGCFAIVIYLLMRTF